MHPEISIFPNKEFYGKKIRNGENVYEMAYERRFLKGEMFGSFSFIDISNGKEELDDTHSRINMAEVSAVVDIVWRLYQECSHMKQKVSVGCISPYKAQVHAIQERLRNTSCTTNINGKFSVNVRSVDGFQGGEEDVIIISTVRCNGNGSVGFLSNFRRANVALTRARYCLWVLGNATTLLNSGSVWKKLVLDAKGRGCFYNAHDDNSLSLAINHALEVDLNSLFCMDSILFRTSKWKVCFSPKFGESMRKHQNSIVHREVVSLLVKLSNGWREQHKDENIENMKGPSSQLLKIYDVNECLKIIWTVEILEDNSKEIQMIKVWDVLPRNEVPKVAKRIDFLLGEYTINYTRRCLEKQIEGKLVLPITWSSNGNDYNSRDVIDELSSKLAGLCFGDK